MGLEFWESQLIHRDVVMQADQEEAADAALDESCLLSDRFLLVRGGDEEAPGEGIERQVPAEDENEGECTRAGEMEQSDLRLVLLPLVVTRARSGRVRRTRVQDEVPHTKEEEPDDEDEGIAGCWPDPQPEVRDEVEVRPAPRKRRHGILVIRDPDELFALVQRKCSVSGERRVSWGTNQTIEIIREEEEEDQDAGEDQGISLFLRHSSDQRVWFASLGFLFLLVSSLPFLSPLLPVA